MEQPLYADTTLQIAYDAAHSWLYINWQHAQDRQSVEQGCARILDCLHQRPCSKVLNDNRLVCSLWTDSAEWVGSYYLPQLAEAGVRKLAWINARSLYGRLSTSQAVAYAQRPLTRLFDDYDEAARWLGAA
jgi:hypothetical protein